MNTALPSPSGWTNGALPPNVRLGEHTLVSGEFAFKRFHTRAPDALVIGSHGTMDGVHFAVGEGGRIAIGNYCYFQDAVLLCELELRIGSYVVIGWNTTITDSDFHPLSPAARIADALACSPLGQGKPRRQLAKQPVIVEDDVWIGPNAAILKGVRIGTGAWVEAGTVITRDVPSRARVLGNPAQIIGEMP